MRFRIAIASLLVCLCGVRAGAKPPDADLQRDLLDLYGRYNQFVAAGKLTDAARLRTAQPAAELLAELKKPKREQAETLLMMRLMTPDTVTPEHANVAADGNSVTIEAIAAKTWPAGLKMPNAPKPGMVTHGEVTLQFARQGQDWKLADQSFGPDPASIKVCHDDATESEASYDHGVSGEIGGQIRRVEFNPDHTLVVIRVVDEENCLILPSRDWLTQHGHPEKLVAWALIEAEGAPHKSDKQRFWADKWTVTDE